jgi:hypothetical protein
MNFAVEGIEDMMLHGACGGSYAVLVIVIIFNSDI